MSFCSLVIISVLVIPVMSAELYLLHFIIYLLDWGYLYRVRFAS